MGSNRNKIGSVEQMVLGKIADETPLIMSDFVWQVLHALLDISERAFLEN